MFGPLIPYREMQSLHDIVQISSKLGRKIPPVFIIPGRVFPSLRKPFSAEEYPFISLGCAVILAH